MTKGGMGCRSFSKDEICKWILSVARNKDTATGSTALRGIRNLIKIEEYTAPFTTSDKFPMILDYLLEEAMPVMHVDLYIFEIYTTLFEIDGEAPNQEVFAERLLKWMTKEGLNSRTKQYCIRCMDAFVRSCPLRDNLIHSLMEKELISAFLREKEDLVLEGSLDLLFSILRHLPDDQKCAVLNDVVSGMDVMENLFQHLKCGRSDLESKILNLSTELAENLPNAFYEDHLDENWIRFQVVLEQGSEPNQGWIRQMMYKISVAEGPTPKAVPLPLPENGSSFLKLILEDLTETAIDILFFLWKNYKDVLPSLIDLHLASHLFQYLSQVDETVANDVDRVSKIHRLLVAIANEPSGMDDFSPHILEFLQSALDSESEAFSGRCLLIGLNLLTQFDNEDTQPLAFLVEKGLASFLNTLLCTPSCLKLIDHPNDLFDVLEKVLNILDPADSILGSLFLSLLDSAEVFEVGSIMQFVSRLDANCPIRMCHVDKDLQCNAITKGLSPDGLLVLQSLVNGWFPGDREEVLVCLFSVLRAGIMNQKDNEVIERSCILQSVANALSKISLENMHPSVIELVFSILAFGSERFHVPLAQFFSLSAPTALENVWNTIIAEYSHTISTDSDKQSVLKLLKTASRSQPPVAQSCHEAQNSELNVMIAALKDESFKKENRIRVLETALQKAHLGAIAASSNSRNPIHQGEPSMRAQVHQGDPSLDPRSEAIIKRLKRTIGEKEETISAMVDEKEKLLLELRNKNETMKEWSALLDAQDRKILNYESVLQAEGYKLDF